MPVDGMGHKAQLIGLCQCPLPPSIRNFGWALGRAEVATRGRLRSVRPRFGGEPGSALTRLGKTDPTSRTRQFGFGIGSVGGSASRQRRKVLYISSAWKVSSKQ